jgi:hypothetical protein
MTGYVFNFTGHGSFAPGGKVDDMTEGQVKAHNAALAAVEVEAMKASGRALLYLHGDKVGTWESSYMWAVSRRRESRHNIRGTRLDVWFTGPDGAMWHGVNIGDNDIVRCKRNGGVK